MIGMDKIDDIRRLGRGGRDGRIVWVEEWKGTVSSVGELLELQSGLGAPVLLEGGRLTVTAEGA